MKSLFNTTLLKEQLKRYWAVGALTFLAYFLCCLLPLWKAGSISFANDTLFSLFEMRHPLILIANIVAPLAAVVAIFSYMYQQNAAGVIHSLPFTKKQLFATNVLTGFLLIAIPLLIFSALLLTAPVEYTEVYEYSHYTRSIAVNIFPNGLKLGEIINSADVVMGFFAKTLLSFTFYYILFITVAMIVGNQVMFFLISTLFPFLASGFFLLYGLIATYYLFGYNFNSELLMAILLFTNPIFMTELFSSAPADSPHMAELQSLVPFIAVYLGIMAVLLAVSAWLYHKRRLERAGDTVVFTPLKNFFIFILSVTGMISMGIFLLALLRSITYMYIGFTVGFIVAFFIAQMITEKSFNIFYKYKSLFIHGGVILGLFAVIQIVCRADITGYARYVPDTSDVVGVYFSQFDDLTRNEEALDMLMIDDPQTISDTLSVHRRIVGGKSELRKVFLANLASDYRTESDPIIGRYITYRLKNGKLVTRHYMLSETFYKSSDMARLMVSEPVAASGIFWADYPWIVTDISLDPYMVKESEGSESQYHDAEYQYMSTVEISGKAEIESLSGALKKDYVTYIMNNYEFESPQSGEIIFHMRVRTDKTAGLREYYYLSLDYGKNTLAWLDEHGYKLQEY